jgi:Flp pilus assembly protein TadG
MKNGTLASERIRHAARCERGASMVEFALTFPLVLVLVFATLDLGFMFFEWNAASKATQFGARQASVSGPVATGLTTVPYDSTQMGKFCKDPATGTNQTSTTGLALCPSYNVVCTANASSGGTCIDGTNPPYAFDEAAFQTVMTRMQGIFIVSPLRREHIEIRYQTSGLGFVGRPGGLPVIVTVSLRCKSFGLFMIDALLGWAAPPSACEGGGATFPIPAARTSIISESLGAS